MSENWQIFTAAELSTICFECPTCHTTVAFPAGGDLTIGTEKLCPGCNKAIPNAATLLASYRRFYQEATQEQANVTLRARTADQK
jgi:hypothetical protein